MSSLEKILMKNVVEKGSEFTHTSLSGGSYYIQSSCYEPFIRAYIETVERGGRVHLTEKHRDIGPIVIDLDFRQSSEEHLYDVGTIKSIINILFSTMNEYLQIEDGMVFVLEKPARIHDKATGIYKDGLHFVFPGVVTKPDFQFFLRDQSLPALGELMEPLMYLNQCEDIYDKAVIKSNNWLMYGSNKPSETQKWTVTKVFYYSHAKNCFLDRTKTTDLSASYLVERLSIRNKYDETPFNAGMSIPIIDKRKDDVPDSASMMSNSMTSNIMNLDQEYVKELVNILSIGRASQYDSWIRVGWCPHNIDQSQEMLDLWIKFSMTSSKFQEGECERLWSKMWLTKDNGLNIGSLCMWAREDNPDQYKEATKKSVRILISKSRSGTHTEIARVIHRCYKDTFVCASMKQNLWFEFRNHKWEKVENAWSLRRYISNEIVAMYQDEAKKCTDRGKRLTNEEEIAGMAKASKEYKAVANKLMMTSFKEGVMKECMELFIDPKFGEKLDLNGKLIGFENGVYDLGKGEFRKGKHTDHMTMCTGYNYAHEDDKEIQEDIMTFIRSIMSNEEMAQYLLKTLAYMICGDKYLEQLWFYTGRGRNGKGTLSALLNKTFGEYYYEPDISIVTTSKRSSSGVSPEMMKAFGKRLLVASEPDDEDKDAKFRVSKLKQLRGNDLIQARGLYKECMEFKPQFAMIFQMNGLGAISNVDDAIAKSLKIVEFPFQFVENPQFAYQRKIDMTLKDKFQDVKYHQQFMRILLKYYKEFIHRNQNIDDPPEVKEATLEYIESSNPCVEWLRKYYEVTNDSKERISPTNILSQFNHDMNLRLNKDQFSKNMKMLGLESRKLSGGSRFYVGLMRKSQIEEDSNDL